jgi:hypothetical protein
VAGKVARTIPRYLVPLPVIQQSEEILAFARAGYATVIVIHLESAQAVSLATEQVQALANLDVPLLLFLDRIGEIRIDLDAPRQLRAVSTEMNAATAPRINGGALTWATTWDS